MNHNTLSLLSDANFQFRDLFTSCLDWLDWFIIRPGINRLLLNQGINGVCDRGLARVSVLNCSELLFRNVGLFSTRTFHPETLFSKSTTIMAAYHLAISLIPIPAL